MGPVFPKTPANYGFTIIAKVKPGREEAIREYGNIIEAAVKANPHVLAPLKLHYLRWVLFDVGSVCTLCIRVYLILILINTRRMRLSLVFHIWCHYRF